ncbi:MAG: MotA/TolQ/ExbB proton channel family protein [Nitrospirota bacterium]
MIPMVIGSIIGLGIVLEKFYLFYKIRIDIPKFTKEIFACIREDNVNRAMRMCNTTYHPLASLFKVGIQHRKDSKDKLNERLEKRADYEIRGLERHLGILVTIVSVAPMLGFLGTIIGLIRAFMAWEQMGNNITVSALAGGIYQAMITTAAGLSIAIPYYICYNYIVDRIKDIAVTLSNCGDDIINSLIELQEKKYEG